MKKIFFLAFFSIFHILGYAQIEFELRTNTLEIEDQFISIICDNAGSLYCTYVKENSIGLPDNFEQSFLLKITPEEDTIWLNYSMPDTLLRLTKLYLDDDGNILLYGIGWKIDTNNRAYGKFSYFIKLNEEFEIFWKKGYHLENESNLTITGDLIENQAGNFLFSATSLTQPAPYSELLYFFEFSSDGDSLNFILMDDNYIGLIRSLTQKSNSGNVYCHMEQGPPPPTGDTSICKRLELNDAFNPVSFDYYPSLDYTGPFYTMDYEENSFLSFGTYWELIEGQRDRNYYLNARILDSSLNIIHQVSLTNPETKAYAAWSRSVDYYYPERIFVVGADKVETSLSFPESTDYIYVACLDEDLNLINEEYLESENDFYLINSMCATPDGGVAIVGGVYNFSYNNYKYDGYLLKLDSLQFVGIKDNNEEKKSARVTLYPNPASNNLFIRSDRFPISFELVDITGKQYYYQYLESQETKLDVSNFPPGMYFWRANKNGIQEFGKLIKK